jgi:two-component system response regulator YesN
MIKQKAIPKIAIEAVNTIKEYIERDPLDRITIPELTAKTTVGKNLIHLVFRKTQNKTIIRFQLEKRMEEACRILEEGRKTISQIAYKCGYREQANFSSDFKKVYGVTPKEWMHYYDNAKYNANGHSMTGQNSTEKGKIS